MTDQAPKTAPPDPTGLVDALHQRIEMAQRATDITAAWLGPEGVAGIKHDVERIDQRLALGIDQTVVALLGGTGSGKSSLFNAVSGLQFADVGVLRPTTQDATACVWGSDATALLDWLKVAPDRRIKRESELDGQDQADLRGLVLLDMPDHDSVVAEHRAKVDRVLPLADLLVWVVDPQKYADDALHSGYLETLHGHEGTMVVVLNQIDRVRRSAVPELVGDVRRLVHRDGLQDLEVMATSVRTGEGIAELRTRLAELVARQTSAVERAGVELSASVRSLRELTGSGEPADLDAARGIMLAALEEATGLDRVAERIADSEPPGTLDRVDEASANRLLDLWLDALDDGGRLGAWRLAVSRALPLGSDLADRFGDVVERIASQDTSSGGKPRRKAAARRAAQEYRDWAAGLLGGALDDVVVGPTRQALTGLGKARDAIDAVERAGTAAS